MYLNLVKLCLNLIKKLLSVRHGSVDLLSKLFWVELSPVIKCKVFYNIQRNWQWRALSETGESISKRGLHQKEKLCSMFLVEYEWYPLSWIRNQNQTVKKKIYCQMEALLKKLYKCTRHWLIVKACRSYTIIQNRILPKSFRKWLWREICKFSLILLYSHDNSSSDYHLYISLQHFLKRKYFINCEEIKTEIWMLLCPKSWIILLLRDQ